MVMNGNKKCKTDNKAAIVARGQKWLEMVGQQKMVVKSTKR